MKIDYWQLTDKRWAWVVRRGTRNVWAGAAPTKEQAERDAANARRIITQEQKGTP